MVRQTVLFGLAALSSVSFAQISDDFESGWDQTKWPIYADSCNQGGSVTLDTTVAHSGSNSMKVTGGPNGFCGHVFFGTTEVPTGDVYVRAWIKPETALNSDHITFIVMPDPTLGSDKHLRFGGMMDVMIYNRESDDATLPSLSPQGVATSVGLSIDGFQCLEYHLGTDGTIETWLNGDAISGLEAGPNADNPNDSGWGTAYKPAITGVYFGWEAYGSDVNTMWYDDVVIGSTRAGCGDDSTTPPSSTGSTGPTSSPASSTTSVKTPPKSSTTTLKTSTKTSATPTHSPTGAAQTMYGQCGGQGWTGPTTCASGSTCKFSNPYYSQCL